MTKTVGQALQDPRTALGRSARSHSKMIARVAALSPTEQAEFWRQAAAAKR